MTRAIQASWLEALQPLLTNPLDLEAMRGKRVAGILGDVPSTYAKSPRLWNAAFGSLGLEAIYVPFDVPQERLRDVLELLRTSDAFLGGSVTVPYKMAVIPLLDAIDPLTARIGAVNVIARTPEGKLIGYNTDGLGGLRALTAPMLPGSTPVIRDLTGIRALVMGAGGAAQALACHLWEHMQEGELVIANRTQAGAAALAQRLSGLRPGRVSAIAERELPAHARGIDLIINATLKGQGGIRQAPGGRWTCLEPYSALGPASPAVLPATPGHEDAFAEAWYRQSLHDIRRNHEASGQLCARLPRTTVCYDIIYAPLESTFLRHARWSGHRTLNGRGMNVAQAVEAFVRYVCREWMMQSGLHPDELAPRVAQAMAEEWGR